MEGDPTEGALLPLAYKGNLNVEEIRNQYKRIKEIPFDSSRRYMTVVVQNNKDKIAFIKGAFSSISTKCTRIYDKGIERLFTSSDKEKIQEICDKFASDAMRVLAFGYKHLDKNSKDIENNFVFLGLVAMEDPPREGVIEAIQKCHSMGIKIIMITGDNKQTATAIGKHLGILTNGIVISGIDLDLMTDEELYRKINNIQVFARTSPEQKHRIVKALKRCGHIVAMTGDGVNDAPAIKEANIGIAMGRGGSDVAKDVASITLADDNFTTIVNAIEEGKK
ncbi:HAD-IC family P-type ATPase [Caloramator sp. mosi_1]|uniref:HAD-IC family P-type ATPase n=1 Tax=Caloramator sp. mosi_1 TaxID=3023090 RepID=UPI002360DD12|nr:HAD-IC family P-type ATPase [Caloramator sp. mosi_1]WDC85668.1 HAD-IC family P-type ATPase [Caloramator sp. mosi_1]